MPLASTAEILTSAARGRRGVGAFNVIQLEPDRPSAGAEQAGAPVILQISENAVKYHGALKPIALATRRCGRHRPGGRAPRPREDRDWSPRRSPSASPR